MQRHGVTPSPTQTESDRVCYSFQISDLIEHGYDPCPDLSELLEAAPAGRFRVPVDVTVPLSKAADAHRPLDDRVNSGKVLLTMSAPAQEGR